MDANGRPDVIPTWLKFGRKYETPPKISSLKDFAECWYEWWRNLQPQYRNKKGGGLSRKIEEGETWSQLRRGGPNGFFMIILTLSWWQKYLDDDDNSYPSDWNSFHVASEDTSFVLDQMLAVKALPKRPLDDTTAAPAMKRQVVSPVYI